ncbi:hypothetical protein GCM10010320_57790 [Streptomyces caelestis]|nr:hypothetical protein GCM10010320_57790 [Streptomyces caelestis]
MRVLRVLRVRRVVGLSGARADEADRSEHGDHDERPLKLAHEVSYLCDEDHGDPHYWLQSRDYGRLQRKAGFKYSIRADAGKYAEECRNRAGAPVQVDANALTIVTMR